MIEVGAFEIWSIDGALYARTGQLVIWHDGSGVRVGLTCAIGDSKSHGDRMATQQAYKERNKKKIAAYHRKFRARRKARRIEAQKLQAAAHA